MDFLVSVVNNLSIKVDRLSAELQSQRAGYQAGFINKQAVTGYQASPSDLVNLVNPTNPIGPFFTPGSWASQIHDQSSGSSNVPPKDNAGGVVVDQRQKKVDKAVVPTAEEKKDDK
uniref:Uncharacterized protein n=1 Tax=Romanomermis culicivorax TaxID=13658 RepID=A0A915KAI6_ROMCU